MAEGREEGKSGGHQAESQQGTVSAGPRKPETEESIESVPLFRKKRIIIPFLLFVLAVA